MTDELEGSNRRQIEIPSRNLHRETEDNYVIFNQDDVPNEIQN
jgi:hypothetical protein